MCSERETTLVAILVTSIIIGKQSRKQRLATCFYLRLSGASMMTDNIEVLQRCLLSVFKPFSIADVEVFAILGHPQRISTIARSAQERPSRHCSRVLLWWPGCEQLASPAKAVTFLCSAFDMTESPMSKGLKRIRPLIVPMFQSLGPISQS